ncbi:hypothetical protein Mapa_002641 [Marchantia paleacea]|nr:hypothetical protein Mapa_002641 [Marchantia paleacea]
MEPDDPVWMELDSPISGLQTSQNGMNPGNSFPLRTPSTASRVARGTPSTSGEQASALKNIGLMRGKPPVLTDEEKAEIYKKHEAEDERRWYVAKSFFDARSLVADHITSYNNFVGKGIQKMFDESEPFEVQPETAYGVEGGIRKVVIRFTDPELNTKPEVEHEDREISHYTDEMAKPAIPDDLDKGKYSKGGKVSAHWLANTESNGDAGAWASETAGASVREGASTSTAGGAAWCEADTVVGKGKGKVGKYGSKWDKTMKPNDVLYADQPGAGEDESVVGKGKGSQSFTSWEKTTKPNEVMFADQLTNSEAPNQQSDLNFDLDIPSDVAGKDLEDLIPKISASMDEDPATEGWGQEKASTTNTANGSVLDEDPDSPVIGRRTRRSKRPKLDLNDDGEDKFEEFIMKVPAKENPDAKRPAMEKLTYKDYGKERREANYKLLPVEARLRGITYSSPIYVKVTMEIHHPRTEYKRKDKASSSTPKFDSGQVQVIEQRVLLGRIPVMVRSTLCHLAQITSSEDSPREHGDCCLDPGGYFIIKGSEKVIVAQEERNGQRVWLSNNKGIWIANYVSRRKGFGNYNYQRTLVKLTPPTKKASALQTSFWPLFTVVLPGVDPIPLALLFCALGVKSDREIIQMICYKDSEKKSEDELDKMRGEMLFLDPEMVQIIAPSLKDADNQLAKAFHEWDENSYQTSKRDVDIALYYIGSRSVKKPEPDERLKHGQELLRDKFLPHVEGERSKAYFLSFMARLICLGYLGRRQPTDRDDFKNKRLEFAGEVISHQFRKLMGHVQNTMRKRIQKHLGKNQDLASIEKYVEDKLITRGFRNSFSSGNWMGHDMMKNSGIVFDLKRGNPISTLCQLRELRQYVPPTVKVGEDARHPTFSQWGRVCPIDTPDGESCGLVKNMALTGIVSCAGTEAPVFDTLESNGVESLEDLPSDTLWRVTKVFVNGRWVGVVQLNRTKSLVKILRMLRKKPPTAELYQMEVVYDALKRELHVSTDAGRVLRPLLVVKKNKLNLNLDLVKHYTSEKMGEPHDRFSWFLQKDVIELLGVEEEEKALIALHGADLERARHLQLRKNLKFSHAEIHPSLILGLSASVIPFPHRNQSSRNLFQAHKHSKQAIGVYVTNLACRADTSGQHLFYPQVQLVKTNIVNCLQKDEIFSGQNAIVAIACYTGYNQEDSIIMDQSALDRGMFRTQHYRTFKSEERSDHETFGKPSASDENGGPRALRSDQILEEDGLPYIGCNLGMNDVIVGKVVKNVETSDGCRMTDTSTRLKAHEKGRVEQVILVQDEEGKKIAKVKLRETRIPQVGDKFSSMHGQKGVVGMVFTQEDLPFTQEGIVPDIIINPHAFPSRQTLGQMCESALGKARAKRGEQLFATPFNPASTVESITDALHQSGYNGWGTETMYNGFTGKAMEAKIFIGSTFYQRLTHMVEDKIKYRSRGHVHPLTRQPVSDRKRHGGVKFGEMERDCLIAHGAAATLQERTFHLSDYHEIHICRGCKQMAHMGVDRVPTCRFCKKDKKIEEIVKVEIPYACKLLIQELQSMGISVGLDTEVI